MAIGKRYIDGDDLYEHVDETFEQGDPGGGVLATIEKWLKRQPKAPKLVSRQGAAKILGTSSPHISRLGDRMPPGIEIEGSSRPVYDREAVEELAREMEAERKAKAE